MEPNQILIPIEMTTSLLMKKPNKNGNGNGNGNVNGNCNSNGNINENINENINNEIIQTKAFQPVCSFGLICFDKKKVIIKVNVNETENETANEIEIENSKIEIQNTTNTQNKSFKNTNSNISSNSNISLNSNKKVKHNSHSLKNNKYNKYTNIYSSNSNLVNVSKIKILKRHESITHTLKNMLGVMGTAGTDNTIDELDGVIDTNDVEEIINMDGDTNQQQIEKEIIVDKILLVQRRNTIGMIEFVRGKYDVSNEEYIVKLFNMMTFDEKRILREYDSFDMIRTLIGLRRDFNYRSEYDISKQKFTTLKQNPLGDQVNKLLDKSYTKWTNPEWGIPKGRRNTKEFDIECAIREFVEETGIKYKNINVFRNIKPLEEIYTGINGVVYKHIYYIAEIKNTPDAIENVLHIEKGGALNNEVGNVKLFSLTECHKLIRPYYTSKLNAIKTGFTIYKNINTFFEM